MAFLGSGLSIGHLMDLCCFALALPAFIFVIRPLTISMLVSTGSWQLGWQADTRLADPQTLIILSVVPLEVQSFLFDNFVTGTDAATPLG